MFGVVQADDERGVVVAGVVGTVGARRVARALVRRAVIVGRVIAVVGARRARASPEPWSGVPSSSVELELSVVPSSSAWSRPRLELSDFDEELRLVSVQGAELAEEQLFELAKAGADVRVVMAASEIASVETPARRKEVCFMCFVNSSM